MTYGSTNTQIIVRNLSVWVEEKPPFYKWKRHTTRRNILNDVNSAIKEGDFAAIIGPSGAGKSTLLASLAGKCSLPASGEVTILGLEARCMGRGISELIPQFEVTIDSLTVEEHLHFMTEMKLSKLAKSLKNSKQNDLVRQLNLQKLSNNLLSSLSGGEKRLLSLASALISDPNILFCDEPTSGLDSYSASLVIAILKKLSGQGHTVICSIHQPSTDTLNQFSSVMLMAEGRLLLHEDVRKCKETFERLGYLCPVSFSQAEFYIKQISGGDHIRSKQLFAELQSSYYTNLDLEDCSEPPFSKNVFRSFSISRPYWYQQLYLLTWRSAITIRRDLNIHIIQLSTFLLSAIAIGLVYIGASGTSQKGIQNLSGFLWLITSEVSYAITYTALGTFGFDLSLYRREVDIYSGSAYYVSRCVCMMPRCFLWPLIFVIVSTLGVQLPEYASTVWEIILVLTITAFASAAYGIAMSALFTSTGAIHDIMPCVDLVLFLLAGVFVRAAALPAWTRVVKFASHFYYGMDAVSYLFWSKIGPIECEHNITNICMKSGLDVIAENDYSPNYYIQDPLGLFLITCCWSVIGYFALMREGRKGNMF